MLHFACSTEYFPLTLTSPQGEGREGKSFRQLKLQTPNTKLQRSSKLQVPSSKRGPRFGAWNLGFLWCLQLGFWCFDSGISLELGVWDLVFRYTLPIDSPAPFPYCQPRETAFHRRHRG